VSVRRLVLPREVAGVNAFEVTGPDAQTGVDAPTGPEDVVVLAVPSPARLLQAGWLDALRRRSWSPFTDWASGALDDPAAEWRYDRLVARWVGSAGADRVHLVAGESPVAVEAALGEIAGEPVTVTGSTRTLTGAEVAAVEALVSELEELGLRGRNAAHLLDGAVVGLVRSPAPGTRLPADAVPEEVRARLADESARMLAVVEASGVHVHGDRSALGVFAAEAPAEPVVGLDAAVALSVGALERVTTWASWGADA
jgi:hypothetical protein